MNLRRIAWLAVLLAGCGSAAGAADGGGATTPSATVQEGIARVNSWRQQAGVAALTEQSQVEAAAQAHLDFILDNPSSCWPGLHQEVQAGCTGFTGASVGARVQDQGYQWSDVGEVIADDVSDADTAVDLWIWEAYHRLIVLDPLMSNVGFSLGGMYAVMDLAAPLDATITPPSNVIVFPAPNMTNVPTSWVGTQEQPTPQAPPGGWPSGPVVSIEFPAITWTLTTVTLAPTSSPSQTEATTLSTPNTDTNLSSLGFSNVVFFYANTPLAAGTSYTVTATGTLRSAPWTQTWAFTTAAQ